MGIFCRQIYVGVRQSWWVKKAMGLSGIQKGDLKFLKHPKYTEIYSMLHKVFFKCFLLSTKSEEE